jgi:small subunit ribosomal protein S1
VVSRRKAIERERKAKRQVVIDSIVEGELRPGRITNLTDYGAFVDLGGADGLIHISDLSWGRIPRSADVLQVGQEVTVRVLKVDRPKGKVSLGLKQATPDPWESVAIKYAAGARVRARVDRLADFGAFLELEQGVDALLPLSEMSWSRRHGRPGDVVRVGQELEVQVLRVEPEKRRISVGLKQLEEDPWATIESRFPLNGKCKGRVAKIMDFGAFVELAPGIEGLIHISELSHRRVNNVGDVVQEGQDVEVRVIRIDKTAQRISLSLKPVPQPRPVAQADAAAPAAPATKPAKSTKQRKKPLRGGLASHFEW